VTVLEKLVEKAAFKPGYGIIVSEFLFEEVEIEVGSGNVNKKPEKRIS
jgi:hypothetical protein